MGWLRLLSYFKVINDVIVLRRGWSHQTVKQLFSEQEK